jgi:hypothetical protein
MDKEEIYYIFIGKFYTFGNAKGYKITRDRLVNVLALQSKGIAASSLPLVWH